MSSPIYLIRHGEIDRPSLRPGQTDLAAFLLFPVDNYQ
jgi:hypothetical protein